MITVHHLRYSQSIRVVWLLEELHMPYEMKLYERNKDQLAPPEFKAISPTGTSPCITQGDVVLSESNAILDYILDQAQASSSEDTATIARRMRPSAESPDRVPYLFWFHASQASLQSLMSIDSLFRIIRSRVPFPISSVMKMVHAKTNQSFIQPRLQALLTMAEEQLTKHDYLGGSHLTAADVTAIDTFDSVWERNDATEFPKCQAWLERVKARPAFESALKKTEQTGISLAL